MARQRLGVVLLVPQPVATLVDGLRKALGDGALGRIDPHVTLVPPVNVPERDVPRALAVVRAAAAAVSPLPLQVGPARTFAPVNPVAYLAVGGQSAVLDQLGVLRAACLQGPLERESEHDFVPHVTLAESLAAERLATVEAVLADFREDILVDRVHVLAEQPGRRWLPIADAPLGERPAEVGRGSLPLEISTSGRPDAEAAGLLAVAGPVPGLPFAVTARRGHQLVAAAWGWSRGAGMELADLVVSPEHRNEGVGRHVLAAIEDVGRRRGCVVLGTSAPAAGPAAALLATAGFRRIGDGEVLRDDRPARWERSLGPTEGPA